MNLQSSHSWLSIHVAPIGLTCQKCLTAVNTKLSKIREEIPASNTCHSSRGRKFVRVMKCIFWQEEEALIDNEGSGDRDPSNPPPPLVPRLPLFRQRWFSGRNYPVEGDEDWQGRSCGWQAGWERRQSVGAWQLFWQTLPPSRFAGAPEFWLLPSQRLVCVWFILQWTCCINRLIN